MPTHLIPEGAILVLLLLEGLILMQLDQLKQEISATVTVEESVLTLLANLATNLAAYKHEPAQIQELADTLVNERQKLAAAITANTVAAPPPVLDQEEADKAALVPAPGDAPQDQPAE